MTEKSHMKLRSDKIASQSGKNIGVEAPHTSNLVTTDSPNITSYRIIQTNLAKTIMDENTLNSKLNNFSKSIIETMESLFDKKFSELEQKMVTKEEFTKLSQEITNIGEDITAVKNDCDGMKAEINQTQKKETQLQKQIDQLEVKLKQNNLIFRGLDIINANNLINEIKIFCSEVLEINIPVLIENAYVMGDIKNKMVLVQFSSYGTVNIILQNANKLKGSSISIQRDYPNNVRIRRSILYVIQKTIKNENPNVKVNLRVDTLFIENLPFFWNEEKELLLQGENNGFDVIHNKFKCNVKIAVSEHLEKFKKNLNKK